MIHKFVGYSRYTGQNLVERYEDGDTTKTNKIPWYKGKTLLEALDEIKPSTRPLDKPCGRVETGILKPGMFYILHHVV